MKARGPLSLALAALLIASAGAQPLRFTLAIVRLDGRLVPIAAYDDGGWERAWPDADRAADRTPTLDTTPSVWRRRGEPVPAVWHVWPASGGAPIQAVVTGVEIVDAHCSRQVALTTDLPARQGEHPHKFGVAVDGDLPIGAVEDVRRPDVSWNAAQQLVAAEADRLEAAQAQAERRQLVRESPAPEVEIARLFRETARPDSPMYFIAEKRYRTPLNTRDPKCPARTIITGWLMPAEDGSLRLRDSRVFLTDCDAKTARRALPLAALRVSGRVFWVLQEHGYENETYVVAEIEPAGVSYVMHVGGGGC